MKLDLKFFGGRGSDSGGWDAPSGGSDQPANIKEEKSLISARETKPKEVDEVLTTLKTMTDQYGVSVDDVNIAVMGAGSRNVLGYFSSEGNLGINQAFFNEEKMSKSYDDCVKQGFHPGRGNKSALEAVAAHEYGHSIAHKIAGGWGGKYDNLCNKITQEAGKTLGYKKFNDFAGKISGYATDSSSECIAEAFADVYCNGSRATKESQALVNTVKKYL